MADISKIKLPNGTIYNIKDETARSNASTKVNKAGDTMTGPLDAASNRNYEFSNVYGINMKNSDIIGTGGIYTNDAPDNGSEGINFYHDDTHWDSLYGKYGTLFFAPKREKNTSGSPEEVVTIKKYQRGTTDPTVRPLVDRAAANRLAFLPPDQVIIEKTTDGGETWTDAEYSNWVKQCLFSTGGGGVYLPLLNGERSTNCGIRITITGMKYDVPNGTAETEKYNYWNSTHVKSQERYFNVREWWFWVSAASDRLTCRIQAATGANSTSWYDFFHDSSFLMTGWSGSDWIRAGNGNAFGGGTTQPTNYWNWRLTFFSAYEPTSGGFTGNGAQSVSIIRCYGDSVWNGGSVGGMAQYGHLYLYDSAANATFPSNVTANQFTATQFNGSLNGNASTASTASLATKARSLESTDTRNTNQPPSWYFTNYPYGIVHEFKTTSAIGVNSILTGFNYCDLITMVPYADSSGGYPIQIAQNYASQKRAIRYGTSNSTWSAWKDMSDAATVNGHTVNSDVPSNAKFTDTTISMSMDTTDTKKLIISLT